jgi:CheY-like chemotaxis protein
MKNILLACAPSQVDASLRRSLAHLAQNCQVDIAHNGFEVFKALNQRAYDLIVLDFAIPGIDSLELVESIPYIDPGVPVMLMIPANDQAILEATDHLKSHVIPRPFKPLTFLRGVDRLLHQQLGRFRDLARTLEHTLNRLRLETNATSVFLLEGSGQVLVSSGPLTEEVWARLNEQLVGPLADYIAVTPTSFAPPPRQQACSHGLYLTVVTDSLSLAAVLPNILPSLNQVIFWSQLDQTAAVICQVLQHQTGAKVLPLSSEAQIQSHYFKPLFLEEQFTGQALPAPLCEEEEVAINWQIINHTSKTLSRLEEFCRVN